MSVVLFGSLGLVVALAAIPNLGLGLDLQGLVGAAMIVVFGFLFVTVSSRLTGTIGSSSNPISGMTVATLLLTCLVFLLMGRTDNAAKLTALTVAAVVCGASSRCSPSSRREGVSAALDGRVLSRQPERVEADREEHVVALHPPEPGERVGRALDVPVPDVQVARRVVVHREQVVLGPARVPEVGLVHPELVPAGLPARLDGARVVALDPASAVGRLGRVWGLGGVGHERALVGRRRRRFTPRRRRGVKVGGSTFLVELRGLEPRTPCMPCRCSSS